jgi:CRP/FNR family transcriptional regulator, cyclic AMP receptor protein
MKGDSGDHGLLRRLPPAVVARLESRGRQRHFAVGEVLLRQDEPNQYLHAIVSGHVRVERVYPNLLPTMLLAEMGPGEVVGEEGLLYGNLRRTTATAVEETETLEVPSEALADVLAEQLQETAALLQLLCRGARAPDSRAQQSEIKRPGGRSKPVRPSRVEEVVDQSDAR